MDRLGVAGGRWPVAGGRWPFAGPRHYAGAGSIDEGVPVHDVAMRERIQHGAPKPLVLPSD